MPSRRYAFDECINIFEAFKCPLYSHAPSGRGGCVLNSEPTKIDGR
jgi:hypothetical protein